MFLLRHLMISLAVGASVGLIFFVAFFVAWGTVGGAMGTAPALSHMYMALVAFTADKILRIPAGGSFFAVCGFWAAVSALLTFVRLRVKQSKRHANAPSDERNA